MKKYVHSHAKYLIHLSPRTNFNILRSFDLVYKQNPRTRFNRTFNNNVCQRNERQKKMNLHSNFVNTEMQRFEIFQHAAKILKSVPTRNLKKKLVLFFKNNLQNKRQLCSNNNNLKILFNMFLNLEKSSYIIQFSEQQQQKTVQVTEFKFLL